MSPVEFRKAGVPLELVRIKVVNRRLAARRMRAAGGGRPSADPFTPGLPLPMARVDKDMRGERSGEVDVEEGLQPRQLEVRGLLREAEDRVLPRTRLEQGHNRGVRGDARFVPKMVQGSWDQERSELPKPRAVAKGFGPSGVSDFDPRFPP